MLIKVLDGCPVNNHFWVFAAATTNVEYTMTVTDTAASVITSYTNELGVASPAITDVEAFATCASGANATASPAKARRADLVKETAEFFAEAERRLGAPAASADKGGPCVPGDNNLCLNQGRFRVEVEWANFADETGPGSAVPFGSDDSGMLWFFAPENWEMLIKILDGCPVNDHFWVFAAATTNVEYRMTVTDTVTGMVKEYLNPLGTAAAATTDTEAFPVCP